MSEFDNPAGFDSPTCLSRLQTAPSKSDDLCAIVKSVANAYTSQEDLVFSRALVKMAYHLKRCKRSCSHIVHLSAVEIIVQAMDLKRDNLELQINACHVLGIFANEDADCQNEIVEKEGAAVVLDMLKKFNRNLEVQRGGFTVLRGLPMTEPGRKALLAQGIMVFLLSVLKKPLEKDEVLVEHAVITSAKVVIDSHESKVTFGELGIVEVITEIMGHFEYNAMVMAQAGLALRNLALCDANRGRSKAGNKIALLFKGLKRHHENGLVVNQMLAAISNTIAVNEDAQNSVMTKRTYYDQMFHTEECYSTESGFYSMIDDVFVHVRSFDPKRYRICKNQVAEVFVCEDGEGCPAIIHTIDNAEDVNDMGLFVKMTRLSDQLCIWERFRGEIGVDGLLDVLVRFFGADRGGDQVDAVLDCILSCLSGKDANKVKFREVHGTVAVLKVWHGKAELGATTEKAIKVLDIGIAGQHVTTREFIQGETEIMAGVLAGMSQFSSCFRMQQNGASTLIKIISEIAEDAVAIHRMRARDRLQKTLELHKGNAVVEFLATQLLSLLFEKASQRTGLRKGRLDMEGGCRRNSRSLLFGNGARNRSSGSRPGVGNRITKRSRGYINREAGSWSSSDFDS